MWQDELKNAITNVSELIELLDLNNSSLLHELSLNNDFPLFVSRGYVARMRKGDSRDPLLQQILPLKIEDSDVVGFTNDPLDECKVNPVPCLLHKYYGRVLITVTSSCAINCRFCFRRHFDYQNNILSTGNLEKILNYINNDSTISEVILSGGEPLLLNDNSLQQLINVLENIKHLKIVRIHTRMPIIIPTRITDKLVMLLTKTRLRVVFVTHCNHAQEINEDVKQAMEKLNDIMLLNQTVLLRGVNDSVVALTDLSWRLFDAGILPYYLHMLDKVHGVAHFHVTTADAKQLMQQVRAQLPGYLVPRLVTEVAGEASKQIIL